MAEQTAAAAAELAADREARRKAEAAAAVDYARLRGLRVQRVERLKAGINRVDGAFGIDPALLELEAEPDPWCALLLTYVVP